MHGQYTKVHKFGVPLHPKNLSQLIHPFHGYLTAFPGLHLSWNELHAIYLNHITASYEKTFGRELLGDELTCLSFWLLQDTEKKGYLTLEELKNVLKCLKFTHLFEDPYGYPDDRLTFHKFKREFKFCLSDKVGEFKKVEDESSVIVRFDLIREIFLERGL